jgi:hypothetical protein
MYKHPALRERKDSLINSDRPAGRRDLLKADRHQSNTSNGHIPANNHVPYQPKPKEQPKPPKHPHGVLETCKEQCALDVHCVTRPEHLYAVVAKGGKEVCVYGGALKVCVECGKVYGEVRRLGLEA